eukprot:6173482-Pleurochrysis_carterae.AAC.3
MILPGRRCYQASSALPASPSNGGVARPARRISRDIVSGNIHGTSCQWRGASEPLLGTEDDGSP